MNKLKFIISIPLLMQHIRETAHSDTWEISGNELILYVTQKHMVMVGDYDLH